MTFPLLLLLMLINKTLVFSLMFLLIHYLHHLILKKKLLSQIPGLIVFLQHQLNQQLMSGVLVSMNISLKRFKIYVLVEIVVVFSFSSGWSHMQSKFKLCISCPLLYRHNNFHYDTDAYILTIAIHACVNVNINIDFSLANAMPLVKMAC